MRDNLLINEIGDAQFYRKFKYANLVERNSILTLLYSLKFIRLLRVVFSSQQPEIHPIALSRFLLSTTEGIITTRSNRMKFRLERIRSSDKEFAYLLYNSTGNTMKLTKFGILVNETTSLFTSIRDSKISRGCEKILEIPEGRGGKFWGPILENPKGRGVIRQIPSVRVVWIFSGTTQFHFASE